MYHFPLFERTKSSANRRDILSDLCVLCGELLRESTMTRYKAVPIIQSLPTTLSPVEVCGLLQDDPFCFFLDSGVDCNRLGPVSYTTGFPEESEHLKRIRAKMRLKEFYSKLSAIKRSTRSSKIIYPHQGSIELKSNFAREDYIQTVLKAKEYIAAGDIYQVNISQRFSAKISDPSFELYKRLRVLNPAPFAAYLDFGGVVVISSSPERFLRISDRSVETRPIKGTRPRGKDELEDERLKHELLKSTKDKAELIMIVDLERNDLGRVCEYGTVSVPEIITIETYATVFHLVSTITGRLKEDKDHIDCIKACFPGGSITGAPKIRSMEIIDELEPTQRKIYTGSIGYIGFNRQTDLNIVIRTMLYCDGTVHFQVGGGIVADSDPALEYEETLHKGKALIEAIRQGSEELSITSQ